MTTSVFPPCPTCAGDVVGLHPIVEDGPTTRLGPDATVKDSDRVVGFTLKPCSHEVRTRVTWANGRYDYGLPS